MSKGGCVLGMGTGYSAFAASVPQVSLWLGKGLQEPCAPNRQVVVYGAALNDVPKSIQWNCAADILDQSSTFDLSALQPKHEVVCALASFVNLSLAVPTKVTFEWHRGDTVIFTFNYTISAGDYAWYGVFAYIGYIAEEISQNGQYSVALFLDDVLQSTALFSVTGITASPPSEGSNTVLYVAGGIGLLALAALWVKGRRKKR